MPGEGGHYGKEVQKSRLSEGRGVPRTTLWRESECERVCILVCAHMCMHIVFLLLGEPPGLYIFGPLLRTHWSWG